MYCFDEDSSSSNAVTIEPIITPLDSQIFLPMPSYHGFIFEMAVFLLSVKKKWAMLRWLSEVASPRSAREVEKRPTLDDGDRMMIDLIIAEVECAVSRFETEQEMRHSERCLREHIADYSWLATDSSARRRKYLSMNERAKVESACCLIIASEWSMLLSTWRSRLRTVTEREDILEAFSSAVHDVISSRPRTNTLTDVLLNYVRHRPSLNSVGNDTPRSDTAELTAISPRFPLDDFSNIV